MDLPYGRRGTADWGVGRGAAPRVHPDDGAPVGGDTSMPVFVLDEDEEARGRVGEILASVGLRVRGFSCTSQFLEHLELASGGCLVLDTRFKSMSGLELQQHLIADGIQIPIIFVSNDPDVRTGVKAVKTGAVDFLSKPVFAESLIDAVSMALVRDHARRCEESRLSGMRQRFETLTPRERQVMTLVTLGKANKLVAADLGISEITVKMHRGRVTQKMGVRSVADLVKAAALLELSIEGRGFSGRMAEPPDTWAIRNS